MPRLPLALLALLASSLVTGRTGAAQEAHPVALGSTAGNAAFQSVATPDSSRPAAAVPMRARTSHGRVRRLLTVVGGTALGAGLGYFSSQVQMSDWDSRSRQADGQALRRRYALGGALAGATVGFVIPVRALGGAGVPRTRVPSGALLLGEDLRKTGFSNAYEAVQALRPRWLVKKEVLSLGDAMGGAAAAKSGADATGDYTILVYMDRAKIGGVETLRQVDLPLVHYIRFFNGSEATYRWGWGHAHGVIYISTTDEGLDE